MRLGIVKVENFVSPLSAALAFRYLCPASHDRRTAQYPSQIFSRSGPPVGGAVDPPLWGVSVYYTCAQEQTRRLYARSGAGNAPYNGQWLASSVCFPAYLRARVGPSAGAQTLRLAGDAAWSRVEGGIPRPDARFGPAGYLSFGCAGAAGRLLPTAIRPSQWLWNAIRSPKPGKRK